MPIKWDPATMATEIPTVDQQHRQLIDWLNELLEAMSKGEGRSKVVAVLDKLDTYVDTHFAFEEGCMTRYKCPVAETNIAAHAYFVETFSQLRAEYEADGSSSHLVLKVQRELADWFANHIKGIDAKLAPCVRRAA
jgi:hemerythrin